MFSAQTEQFALYHITDPVQYFNKQDIWDLATTPDTADDTSAATAAPQQGSNGGRNTTLPASNSPADPLYLSMQLPGAKQREFTLERAFTPRRKTGILSSFMIARNDGANYGQLMLYSISDQSASSAAKAASAIESDQFISSQFTLLGQGGSKVEQGEVQLIPVGSTVMYVRPIWITGQSSQPYPRYRFVAAVVGDRSVLGYNVADAVTALVSGGQTQLQRDVLGGRSITAIVPANGPGNNNGQTTTTTTPATTPGSTVPPSTATATQLLAEAQTEFDAADASARAGNLGDYQTHVNRGRTLVAQAAVKLNAAGAGTTTPTTAPRSTTTTRP